MYGYADGYNVKARNDLYRPIDRLRYMYNDLIAKKLYINIGNKNYEVLGKVGMYHIIIDITGSDIKVEDDVNIKINPIFVSSGIKREYV